MFSDSSNMFHFPSMGFMQTGLTSPTKLRMKLMGHQRKKDASDHSNSARTPPSQLQDIEFVENSLLASNITYDEQGQCFDSPYFCTCIYSHVPLYKLTSLQITCPSNTSHSSINLRSLYIVLYIRILTSQYLVFSNTNCQFVVCC